jgi:aminopeptidase
VTTSEFETKLASLAAIGVQTGVNLQSGQELIVSAPIEASSLVGHITRVAYQRGAKAVTCLYDDPAVMRARFDHARDAAVDYATAWLSRGISTALEEGAARLFIAGPYPDLLAGISPDKVRRAHASAASVTKDEMRFTLDSQINWSVLPFVTTSWAHMVFPDLPRAEAVQRLWDAVFDATRVNGPNPRESWREHARKLNARRERLRAKELDALHFYDDRTDLRVGLVKGHRWVGGSTRAANGVEGVCNIPSEEIFTAPHRDHVDGHVILSKPLAVAGALIENVRIEFRDGVAVSITGGKGGEVMEQLLSVDEGARRVGEIALVPHSSPISSSGILFYSVLFDENAACHFAFGQSYGACLSSQSSTGANASAIHLDCMFGGATMNADGICEDGRVEPILRSGEFVF